jgi:hypothetical protein
MSDDLSRTQKSRTIGYLPKDKIESLEAWSDYKAAGAEFIRAKTASEKAKDAVRAALKQKLGEHGDIDFSDEGERIRVFERLEEKRRGRANDLSDRF